MATVLRPTSEISSQRDVLLGTDRARGLDRWMFVLTAALYIVIVLVGFIPDSIMKVAMVKAGLRPPFPPIMHIHAVAMGSFLLFLLAQTWLAATGRMAWHQRIGPIGGSLAALLVVIGLILAPTMYYQVWDGIQAAPEQAKDALRAINHMQDNILLMQISLGLLFALFISIGLSARLRDSGLHKRMMMIAPAMPLPAAFDRISWLPTTMPVSPAGAFVYPLLALAPLFLWDLRRNRRLHPAWWMLMAVYAPVALLVCYAWDKPWWHETARRVMGV